MSYKSTYYCVLFFFFFNDTATTEIYTLSLHDALPIYGLDHVALLDRRVGHRVLDRADDHIADRGHGLAAAGHQDRKSTRLNSSHANISYAVFCLKKKTKKTMMNKK